MITFCIIFIIYTVLKAITHYGFIEGKSLLWHGGEAASRIMVACYISSLVFGSWTMALVALSFFWIAFDMMLNKFRGKKLLYVGQTSIIDSVFVNAGMVANKKPGVIMLVVKIILFVGLLLIYVLNN